MINSITDLNLNQIWQIALGQLQTQMIQATYDSCLDGSTLLAIDDHNLTIGVKNDQARSWLQNRLNSTVTRTLAPLLDFQPELKFIVNSNPTPPTNSSQSPNLPHSPNFYTAYDILTTDWPEPVWAIPNLLPAGLAGFSARPKTGKSWLALQLAKEISIGGQIFGHQVEKGKFLYLALEDSPRRLRDRMEKQGWSIDERQKLNNFVLYDQFLETFGSLLDEGADILGQMISRYKYRLVIIDTLSWAFPGDQDKVDQMTDALGPVKQAALANNCVILVIDHHNKRVQSGQDLILDWMGSIAKAAIADTIWGMYREQGRAGAKLLMTGKDIEDHVLLLSFTANGTWQIDADDGFQVTDRRQEILDILVDLGHAKVGEIANAIEQNRGNTHRRLQDMVNAGLVTRIYQDNGSILYEPSQEYLFDLNNLNTPKQPKHLNKLNTEKAA